MYFLCNEETEDKNNIYQIYLSRDNKFVCLKFPNGKKIEYKYPLGFMFVLAPIIKILDVNISNDTFYVLIAALVCVVSGFITAILTLKYGKAYEKGENVNNHIFMKEKIIDGVSKNIKNIRNGLLMLLVSGLLFIYMFLDKNNWLYLMIICIMFYGFGFSLIVFIRSLVVRNKLLKI